MHATKGTLGTVEKGEGTTGKYISEKEQINTPSTSTDYLLYTWHCGGKCCYFFCQSCSLPVSQVESWTKKNAEEVGMEYSFLKCAK